MKNTKSRSKNLKEIITRETRIVIVSRSNNIIYKYDHIYLGLQRGGKFPVNFRKLSMGTSSVELNIPRLKLIMNLWEILRNL